MSHSCFCTSDSHLKSLFHLKYSSETWSHSAAALCPVQPGYTTRFAFKESLTVCPTLAASLEERGWLECTPHWELLQSCICALMRQFPRTKPAPSSTHLPKTWAFRVSPLAVQYRVIRLRQMKHVFSNLICSGGGRATSWSSEPHRFLTHWLLELLISVPVASPPCQLPSPSLFPSPPEWMKNSVPSPDLPLPPSTCWQKFLL